MMVSARKTKARLDKNKLPGLKNKNTEKQDELVLSTEEAQAFSDDLVKSAVAGFEAELQKSSPAMKELAANLSGMIQEFFIGFKQGVDAELNIFIKDTSKTLAKSVSSMNVAVAETMQKTSDVLKEPIQDLAEEVKETRKEREKVTKEQKTEMVISDVLKRPTEAEGAAKTVLGKKGNVKDWLTRVGLGSIGMEETAEKIVGQRQQKEAFIQTESKLRAKEFEGMDPKEVRKTLGEQFKVTSETTEKLRGVEKEIGAYKDLGYSEDQAEKLAGGEKQALTEKLIATDPSRLGKYSAVPAAAPVSEETMMEQAQLDKEAAKQRDTQTTLLSEIRDLLKAPKQGTTAAPDAGGPSLPSIDLPGVGKGKILKTAGRAALSVAKKAAPWAIAGAIMLGGINAVDTGLGKLGVGKDKEGNDLAIDETQDEANWQKMSTGGKIMSGAARGIERVGGFLGLDSLTRGARADRIKSETEYLKGKEATVQDVKAATSEVQQNRVETQSNTPSELEQRRAKIVAMATPGESAFVTKGREKTIAAIDREIAREKAAGGTSTQPSPQTNAKEYMIDSRQIPAPVEKKGFFSSLVDKTKSLFGMDTAPTVESTNTTSQLTKTDASTTSRLTNLEQQREKIAAMPEPETLAAKKGREKTIAALDREIAREKSAIPANVAPTNLEKTSDSSWSPIPLATASRGAASSDWNRMSGNKNPDGSPMTVEQINAAKAAHRAANMSSTGENYLQEAAMARENGVAKPLPSSVTAATPDQSAKQTAAEIGKNITIQAPAPVVIPAPAAPAQSVSAPFTSNIRNNEPSISDYLRSRYAY